jgi:hypothetical protein
MRGGYEGKRPPEDKYFWKSWEVIAAAEDGTYLVTAEIITARYAKTARDFDTSSCFARVAKPTSCGFQAKKRLPWDNFP